MVAALEQERIPVTDREFVRLYLSDGTVRNYTSNLMAKCGVRNRVELVRIATDRGRV